MLTAEYQIAQEPRHKFGRVCPQNGDTKDLLEGEVAAAEEITIQQPREKVDLKDEDIRVNKKRKGKSPPVERWEEEDKYWKDREEDWMPKMPARNNCPQLGFVFAPAAQAPVDVVHQNLMAPQQQAPHNAMRAQQRKFQNITTGTTVPITMMPPKPQQMQQQLQQIAQM